MEKGELGHFSGEKKGGRLVIFSKKSKIKVIKNKEKLWC